MTILQELFPTIAEFRKYAPYAESNITFDQLNSSAVSAKKMMIIILTKDVYSEIVKVDGELKEALCMAMANLTMAKQLIFDIVSKRKNDVDIYKHEQETMRRSFIENYFNAMDTVIQLLDTEDKFLPGKKPATRNFLMDLEFKVPKISICYTPLTSLISFSSGQYLFRKKLWTMAYPPTLNEQKVKRMYCGCFIDAWPNKPLPLHSDVLISLSFRLRSGACSMIPKQVDPEKMSRNACLLYPLH